jgi:two-component system, NtrC family, response regulator AtoC
MATVLIVDDQASQRLIMSSILRLENHIVYESPDVDKALCCLGSNDIDVILTDLNMPGENGMALVEHVSKKDFHPEIIVITAYGSIDTAIRAIRLGAYDYLNKPIDQVQLLRIVEQAAAKRASKKESKLLRDEIGKKIKTNFIAESSAIRQIIDLIPKIAASDATVLIRGESGTGKEKIASLIHLLSTRSSKQMQSINCAAFPDTLLESELFGYEKGSFTGAQTRKTGIIEAASGSTLFLDEVADMPLNIQVKILRVIQEKEIRRVGSTESFSVDFRLVAASNRPLEEMIQRGLFREDLFYRLNVIPIIIPPLRERKEDIPKLIIFFLSKKRNQKKKITNEAMDALLTYRWTGNVRELESVIERIVILSDSDTITIKDIPREIINSNVCLQSLNEYIIPPEGINFDEFEKKIFLQALQRSNGNMSDAAKLLGTTYRTFQYRVSKFNIKEN